MNIEKGCHTTEIRVRYAETDKMGLAYNGHYLTWFEVGRTEFLRDIGFTYNAKKPVEYETGMFVRKEIEIYGSRNCEKDVDFPAVMAYLEKGRIPVEDVISRVVTLDEAGPALAEWSDNPGPVTKILVNTEA